MDLFDFTDNKKRAEPLAQRMRPRSLDDFIGQEHIVGRGKLLRRAIEADQLTSVIFYGPPGTGKTTLAMVISGMTKSKFVRLNAVTAGVKDLRNVIDEARENLKYYQKKPFFSWMKFTVLIKRSKMPCCPQLRKGRWCLLVPLRRTHILRLIHLF